MDQVERLRGLARVELPEEYAEIVRLVPVEAADRVMERLRRGPLTWREVLECLNGVAGQGGRDATARRAHGS